MTSEKKLNDLDYCYASWLLLKDLEGLSYSRNTQIRKFRERENNRLTLISAGIASILPVVVWLHLIFSSDGLRRIFLGEGETAQTFITRLIGLVFATAFLFVLVFFLVRNLWGWSSLLSVRKKVGKSLKEDLTSEIKKIDQKVKKIAFEGVFAEQRIPDHFLTPMFLMMIIRYLERGQAVFLKEAVYALELELKNTGHYDHLVKEETLLNREKSYLADPEGNLEVLIKEGESDEYSN